MYCRPVHIYDRSNTMNILLCSIQQAITTVIENKKDGGYNIVVAGTNMFSSQWQVL